MLYSAVDKIFKMRGRKKAQLIGTLAGLLTVNKIFVADMESTDKNYWEHLAVSLPKSEKLKLNRIIKEVKNG